MTKFQKIASLASEAPSRTFPQRLEALDEIIKMWERDIEIHVQPVGHDEVTEKTLLDSEILIIPTFETQEEIEEHIECDHHEGSDNDTTNAIDNCSSEEPNKNNILTLTVTENKLDMNNLPIIPPKLKKRGRPKGRDVTVVGLPAKKRNTNKPPLFHKKSIYDRDLQMLQWFVSKTDAENAMSKKTKLTEKEVETNHVKVPSSCLDPNIDINSINHYFTADGWQAVDNVYQVNIILFSSRMYIIILFYA